MSVRKYPFALLQRVKVPYNHRQVDSEITDALACILEFYLIKVESRATV